MLSCQRVMLLAVLLLTPLVVSAKSPALISIVIDDIGYDAELAQRALKLPGPVTYGILPGLPQSADFAREAHAKHRDVLLHIPMEPIGDEEMGPGGLTTNLNAREIKVILDRDLSSVPHAIGISNHMGSRFTADKSAMTRFMSGMDTHRHLFFLDSLTTATSKVKLAARIKNIKVLSRDVFLDNIRDPEKIAAQFDQLIRIAKKRGYALAIAHPHPETLEFLEKRLHDLKSGSVRLVPISLLLQSSKQEK